MSLKNSIHLIALAIGAMGIGLAGCNKAPETAPTPTQVASEEHGHDHSGWWCDPHGVPEEICALCDPKVAADLKAKGDWCEEHGRPDSQCFICHPEKEAEFAALYEAKYGKKPPKPEGG
jgi:cobalt-zinc-cadmium efflux system membrane fusion protein